MIPAPDPEGDTEDQVFERRHYFLLSCPRKIRIRAVEMIPDLIQKLEEESESFTKTVRKAKQLADELVPARTNAEDRGDHGRRHPLLGGTYHCSGGPAGVVRQNADRADPLDLYRENLTLAWQVWSGLE
jgi:hypothetical protein